MANTLGFLTLFDGTTLINHAALKAASVVQNTSSTVIRTYTLPNGAKLNYDGTTDSATTPGRASQTILCKSGGEALYAALIAKLGNYGVLTITKLATGTLTCNSILESVQDVTPQDMHSTGYMHITVTFELLSDWA